MGVGRGYGKLLLFGEHAAVYGHPAVGVRLDDYLEVELDPAGPTVSRDEREHEVDPGWSLPPLSSHERKLIADVLTALPGTSRGGRLEIRGTLPTSVGFGSSAAFCTALLRATERGRTLDERSLWEESHRLEHVFHGTPSGIDTGLSIYPGASIIYPNPPGLPRRARAHLPRAVLLVGAVPRTSSTATLVAGIRAHRERDAGVVDGAMDRLGALSQAATDRNRCPGAEALGEAADEAQDLLRDIGLSTPELELALETMRAAGAYGAKLSGAGGGGAFYGVFGSVEAADEAAGTLEKKMAQADSVLVYLRPVALSSPVTR